MRQKWDCSKIEDSFEERDVMDWYEDDQMMRQLEGVSEEAEKIVKRRTEGNGLHGFSSFDLRKSAEGQRKVKERW